MKIPVRNTSLQGELYPEGENRERPQGDKAKAYYQNKSIKTKYQNKIPKKGGNTDGTEGCRDQKDVFAEAPAFPGVDPKPVP
jgi:hypothetical protein